MRWLPVFYVNENTICASDGEFDGWLIGVEWRGIVVEFSYAKRSRFVEPRD
jgi:hypothetical protein